MYLLFRYLFFNHSKICVWWLSILNSMQRTWAINRNCSLFKYARSMHRIHWDPILHISVVNVFNISDWISPVSCYSALESAHIWRLYWRSFQKGFSQLDLFFLKINLTRIWFGYLNYKQFTEKFQTTIATIILYFYYNVVNLLCRLASFTAPSQPEEFWSLLRVSKKFILCVPNWKEFSPFQKTKKVLFYFCFISFKICKYSLLKYSLESLEESRDQCSNCWVYQWFRTPTSPYDPHFSVWPPLPCMTPTSPYDPHFFIWPPLLHMTPTSPYDPHFSIWPPLLHMTPSSPYDPHFSIWPSSEPSTSKYLGNKFVDKSCPTPHFHWDSYSTGRDRFCEKILQFHNFIWECW